VLLFVGKSRQSGVYAHDATPKPTRCNDGTWAGWHNTSNEYDDSWAGDNDYDGWAANNDWNVSWAGNNDYDWWAGNEKDWSGGEAGNDDHAGGWATNSDWNGGEAGNNEYDEWAGNDTDWSVGEAGNNDYGGGWAANNDWIEGEAGNDDYDGGGWATNNDWSGGDAGRYGYGGKKRPIQPAGPPPAWMYPGHKSHKVRLAPSAKHRSDRRPEPKSMPSKYDKDTLKSLKSGVHDFWEDIYSEMSAEWVSDGGNEPPEGGDAADDDDDTGNNDDGDGEAFIPKVKRARGTKHRAGKKIQLKRFQALLDQIIQP
jgi:hypothetical protein